MTSFSPREHFQLYHPDEATWLVQEAQRRPLILSLDFTMAQVAAQGATAEELRGIRDFIAEFLTLGDKVKAPVKFPTHPLTVLDQHPGEPKSEGEK
jgi:hypothetical protein